MQKPCSSTVEHPRDPVALMLEKELTELARRIDVEAVLNPDGDGEIELRFDNVVVRGETRDIALLRLTSALLEVERFREPLVTSMGGQLHTELAAHRAADPTPSVRMSTTPI